MSEAKNKLSEIINTSSFNEVCYPVVSNFNAKPSISGSEIKDLLVSQIEGKVRWLESIEFMINEGTKNFIEIGPGKVLSGLIKRINKNANIKSINNEEDIKELNLYV